jgi:hypothetical protein
MPVRVRIEPSMPAPTHLQLTLQVPLPRDQGGGLGWGPVPAIATQFDPMRF